MKLVHYSYKSIDRLIDFTAEHQPSGRNKVHHAEVDGLFLHMGAFKPAGLWLSVVGDDDWKSWCQSENFRDVETQYAYLVTLKSDANVLLITNSDEIEDFHSRFSVTDHSMLRRYSRSEMNWQAVAEQYNGVIIAPYLWSHRLDGPVSHWYYSWDCASGVIWNAARAVEDMTLIARPADPYFTGAKTE